MLRRSREALRARGAAERIAVARSGMRFEARQRNNVKTRSARTGTFVEMMNRRVAYPASVPRLYQNRTRDSLRDGLAPVTAN